MLHKKRKHVNKVLLVFLLIPVISFIIWLFQGSMPLSVVVIDKTVVDESYQEHRSFFTILNHKKWVKPSGEKYKAAKDYLGIIPTKRPIVILNDLAEKDTAMLNQMARKNDLLYLTDTYGVYTNEWNETKVINEYSKLVYGGSKWEDVYLAEQMVKTNKLVLGEFNIFANPTVGHMRTRMENVFGVKWTGWTGRYFENMKEKNDDLPPWVVRLYKQKYNTEDWPFRREGLVFVHESGDIVVLDGRQDFVDEVWPIIYSLPKAEKGFDLPKTMPYSYWFDVVTPQRGTNLLSQYQLFLTQRGDSTLLAEGIPNKFAALTQKGKAYYMAGDFCDNKQTNGIWQYMYGAYTYFNTLPVNTTDGIKSRKSFFRHYYFPFIKNVIEKEVLSENS